ncbi:MAG: arsenate reductase (glutaredoxin) [Gammaproteobacteria bacterium]|jgi:arsenate reductase|nr:arsenate reductase (glutaredoxin) [Gammaproteobacteria bacterium]MDP6617017.1 arsenate reductase (glutaredoxin) [Gammaproteobacteria bacterium]MDP6695091.1 arsenate reductase (glutaredoxin) [Gammaproteobacteria bacterium]MDP7041310.1 arsenate reductase (glutaredoxin) [Gammaproteobacteria bacterium]
MPVKIYHNPRCSKSRQTLALLEERGVEPEIIEYLNTPPDADTLVNICAQLGISVHELMRTGEDEYQAAQAELEGLDEAQLANWLAGNPRVIQRPIVVTDKGARIGRPPESVLEILD